MKKNIEDIFSLKNAENYKHGPFLINVICNKYVDLLIEFCNSMLDNNLKQSNSIQGINTLTNVFLHILYYTQNIDLTYFYCQKSYYYYIEFINQISEDDKTFLQLTSKDATLYVYKKTIYEINKTNAHEVSIENKNHFKIINNYIQLCKIILFKIIRENKNNTNIIQYSLQLKNLPIDNEKINNITNFINNNYYKKNIDELFKFIENEQEVVEDLEEDSENLLQI